MIPISYERIKWSEITGGVKIENRRELVMLQCPE